MNEGEDFYITLLKYTHDKIISGEAVHFSQVKKHIQEKHPSISEKSIQYVFFSALEPIEDMGQGFAYWIEHGTRFTLSVDAYFHLLEHEELQDARTSFWWSIRVAIFAILLSAASFGFQIWLQLRVPLPPDFSAAGQRSML